MKVEGPHAATPAERRIFRKVEKLALRTGYYLPKIRWRRCRRIPCKDEPRGDHAMADVVVDVTGPIERPSRTVTIWVSDRAVQDTVMIDACVHEVAHAIVSQMVNALRWDDGHIATWGVVHASLVRNLDAGPPIG